MLAAATVFVAGFRVGLNVRASNVIDVGYSGVIGADRIAHGQSPYGHFPVEDDRPKCGPADADGEVRDRIQTNGRCENANPYGDTYGPVSYIAYLPGYAIFGWSGQWDSLPAVHFTSILFDLLAHRSGWRSSVAGFGGPRLAATLAFAWVAWPFTQYASSSNTNDAIAAGAAHLGLPRAHDPGRARCRRRGLGLDEVRVAAARAALARLSGGAARPRSRALCSGSQSRPCSSSSSSSSSRPRGTPRASSTTAPSATRSTATRRSRSGTGGSTTPRACPNLQIVQRVLEVLLVVGSLSLAWVPRRRSPLRMAALTGAVLVGFELVLTHWFYLYLPWFFPFIALALIGPLPGDVQEQEDEKAAVVDAPVPALS